MTRLLPARRSASPRSVGGVTWPTLRLIILAFNFLFIVNLVFFSAKERRKTSSASLHTVISQHKASVLSHCEENSFDLRNERHRNHKSPFGEKFCEALPLGATAASLWNQLEETIYKASLHPSDKEEVHAAWTKDLQKLLTPHFLKRGLRNEPSHESLQKVFRIVQNRLKDPQNAPPLQVAIVGGSVTEGGGCDKIPREIVNKLKPGEKPVIQGGNCAWPNRLKFLADALLGPGVVQIYNLAVGGTNSNLAVPILDYWLFPYDAPALREKGPDVIINGYAANDNLTPANKRGEDTNMTADLSFFYDYGMKVTDKFIRTSLHSRPCQNDPLVIYVDEYLGNQHNLILGELFRFEGVDVLTDWYANAVAISPAQVVRRLVYAKNDETLFTATWKNPRGQRKIDVHFGMPGHVHIAWTVAYSVLQMALNFCEEETSRAGDHSTLQGATQLDVVAQRHHEQHHDVATKFVSTEALELVEREIPPALNATLQVKDVAQLWHDEAAQLQRSKQEFCSSKADASSNLPCPFAFVAAPMGTVRNAGWLNGYVKPFILHNDGWAGQQDMRNGWQNKLGYVATKANATVTLRIQDIHTQVRTIILHSLKSYGDKWEGSKAKFTLSWKHDNSGKSYSTSWEILGYHDQQTSIGYAFKLELEHEQIAEKGSTVDLQIDLIGGSTFKIGSMMLCSR